MTSEDTQKAITVSGQWIDFEEASREARGRSLLAATAGVSLVGLFYSVRYLWMGARVPGWTILAAIFVAAAAMLLVRRQRVTLAGHLAASTLFAVLIVIATYTGGIERPDFAWLAVVPVVVAFFVGLRAAWVWLGLVWLAALLFWTAGPAFVVDLVPEESKAAHWLYHRLGLSLALVLITTLFVRALRSVEQRLSATNRSLALEIDSRESVEAALRESESRYRDLVENSPSMIYTHDLDGRMQSANRSLLGFLGDGIDSGSSGKHFEYFIPGFSDEARADYLRRILEQGRVTGLVEVRIPSGETKLIEYESVLRAEDSAAAVVRGVARDVTEQERARRALVRQVEQEGLVSGIATRFISVDGEEVRPAIEIGLGELGTFADVDQTMLCLLGESGTDIGEVYQWSGLASPAADWAGNGVGRFPRLIERLSQLETVIVSDTSELESTARDELSAFLGPEVVSALLVPLVGRDGLLGILSLMRTGQPRPWPREFLQLAYISGYIFTSAVLRVREQERALRLEQEIQQGRRMESLGLVASGIAHDFNNHLMGILGNGGLLEAQLEAGSEKRDIVDQIMQSARRAAQLTGQMLSFSGSANMIPETVDLDELLAEVVAAERARVAGGIDLDLWLGGSLPKVSVDQGQVKQVVRNLVANAVEAMEGRRGRVQVRSGIVDIGPDTRFSGFCPVKRPLEPGPHVFIQVSDAGCGIAPEDITRIFDPFYSTRFQGRGLGLAAVLGIVRAHQGAIEVKSELERGTTVRIVIPAAERVEKAAGLEGSAEVVEKSVSERGSILVVDDEESVVEVVMRMLETFGFHAVAASSEDQVCSLAKERGDDLRAMLLDFSLAGGGDVSRTLSDFRASGLEIPVIVMSGFSAEEMRARAPASEVAGFLEKPFGSDLLLSELERVLGQ